MTMEWSGRGEGGQVQMDGSLDNYEVVVDFLL